MKSDARAGMPTLYDVNGDLVSGVVEASGASPSDTVDRLRNDYAVTPVTTGADVVLIAAALARITSIEIFDSSGETLELKVNGVRKLFVTPGGNDDVKAFIMEIGDSLEVRAVSLDATVGELTINFFG